MAQPIETSRPEADQAGPDYRVIAIFGDDLDSADPITAITSDEKQVAHGADTALARYDGAQ